MTPGPKKPMARREYPSPMPEYPDGGARLAHGDLTMAAHAPGRFEAAKSPTGWTYTLNPADRQPAPWPAWVRWLLEAVTIALIVVGVGLLGWCVATTSRFEWDGDRVVPGLSALAYLIGGAALAIGPLRRRAGRCELRLDAGAIRAIWRLGPISWSKTVPRSDAAQLAVVRRSYFRDARPIGGRPGDYHVLVAEDQTGRRRDLVADYPRDVLLALAVELSSRWKAPDIDPDVDGVGAGKLAVVEDTEIPTDIRERRDRPLGSRLICEPVGGRGVRITKPPDGLARNAGCLLVVFELGVAALILAVALPMPLLFDWSGGDPRIARILTHVGAGLGILWCAFSLVVAVVISTGRFVLTATPDRLTLETGDALCGTSCRTWKKPDIAWIRAETTIESGVDTETGAVATTRVLICTTSPIEPGPDELWWGSGREISKPEMEWIVTTVRAVLGVPATDAPIGDAIRAVSDEPRGRVAADGQVATGWRSTVTPEFISTAKRHRLE
jgi:hypothetical protein